MKKIVAILLATTALVALTGCGNSAKYQQAVEKAAKASYLSSDCNMFINETVSTGAAVDSSERLGQLAMAQDGILVTPGNAHSDEANKYYEAAYNWFSAHC